MNEQEQTHTDAIPNTLVFKVTTPDGKNIEVEAKGIGVPKGYVLQTQEDYNKAIGKAKAQAKRVALKEMDEQGDEPPKKERIIELLEQMLAELQTINHQM